MSFGCMYYHCFRIEQQQQQQHHKQQPTKTTLTPSPPPTTSTTITTTTNNNNKHGMLWVCIPCIMEGHVKRKIPRNNINLTHCLLKIK